MQINLANLLSRRSAVFLLLYVLLAGCKESPAPAEAKRSKMFADFFVRYVAPDQEIRLRGMGRVHHLWRLRIKRVRFFLHAE